MTEIAAIIFLSILSGMTTIIGVALAMIFKKHTPAIAIGMGFSTGIMLLISFFDLIPESLTSLNYLYVFGAVFLGAFVLAFANYLIPHIHFFKEEGKLKSPLIKSAYLIAIGLILHDFPEGFAMANSYIYSPNLGIFVAASIALHNIPEEFAIAAPFVVSGKGKRQSLFKAAFVSGLAEPAGALLGLIAVGMFSVLNPFFMSSAAGAMIFISLHELIPLANKYKNPHLFVLGMVTSVFIYMGLGAIFPN